MGHALSMDGNRIPRRIMEWKPVGRRGENRRPRKRWVDDIEKDIQVLDVKVGGDWHWRGRNGRKLLRRPKLILGYSTSKRRRRRRYKYM